MRFLATFLLLVLLAPVFGVAATTTIDLRSPNPDLIGTNTQATINSTENILAVQVSTDSGVPRIVQLYSPDTAWILRTTTADSTTDLKIAIGQVYKLPVYKTRSYYFVRQSADGTL